MSSGLPLIERPGFSSGDYGAIKFLVKQEISKINTLMLVKVVSANLEELNVTVQPLVNMVNGNGEGIQYGEIPNIPFFRLRGGINEIQLDPAEGDIGLAAFCSRDISVVRETKEISNPGTWAQYALSDGIYLGGVINTVTPATNYIKMDDTGITILSTEGIITLTAAAGVYVNGSKIG